MNNKSISENMDPSKISLYKRIATGLEKQPAYLLVFAVSALFVLTGLVSSTTAVLQENIDFAFIGLISFAIALVAVVVVVREVERKSGVVDSKQNSRDIDAVVDGSPFNQSLANIHIDPTRIIVIYMPLLHLNPFFSTFLEGFCDRAQKAGFNVIVKTGHNINHVLNWSVDQFLEDIQHSPLQYSAIAIFPPHPEVYKELLDHERIKDFQKLNVILMDIDPLDPLYVQDKVDALMQGLSGAEYIKAVIVLDNKKACIEAARAVLHSVEGKSNYVNIMLCDGDYHGRAAMFRDAMNELSKRAKRVDGSPGGILAEYLPRYEESSGHKRIKFSSALKDAYDYVSDVIQNHLDKVSQCPTFIFCANDVIALGAREALDIFPQEKLEQVFIIAYDGSSLLDAYVSINDPYIRILLSQNYNSYTDTLLKEIKNIVDKKKTRNQRVTGKIKRIAPEIQISSINFGTQQ